VTPRRVTRPRAFRAFRGVLLGSTTAALAVFAHGMAGGGVPDAAIMVVLTGLVAWAGTAVARRTQSAWAMFALLGASQLSLHVLLTYVSDHDSTPPGAPMLAAHAVATALTAVLLTRADAMLDLVAAALAGLVRAMSWTPEPPAARRLPARYAHGSFLRAVFQRAQPRRGPPVFS